MATSAIPTRMPTTMPTTRAGIFCLSPNRHERALDNTNALVSERPAVAMPTRPTAMASHGVVAPCSNAWSIWVASDPVTPASLATDATPK